MHKRIIKRGLVVVATFSCLFARTKAESLVQTGRDGYGNSLYAYQGETTKYYNNFSETNTIYVGYKGSLKTDAEYNVLQLRAGGNGRRSVQMFWNKNGDINWINGRKLILNSGWCYSTNTVVGTQCPSYDLTIQDIKQVGNTTFTDFTVQTNAGTDPGAWYSYGIQFFCLYNEQGNSYCTKSGQPEQYNNDATVVALCGDDLGCSAGTFETLYGNSPFTAGGGNGTGSMTMNTNTYFCPTIQQLIDTYDTSIYNEDLCYSSSIIYSGGQINRITPKTMEELYPTYTGFYQDMIAYDTYCRAPYNNETCRNVFTGKEIEYTLLAKIPTDVHGSKVYQYCHLQTLPNKNLTTCTANGTIAEGIVATGTTAETGQIQITSDRILNELTNGQTTLFTPEGITIILSGNNQTATGESIYSDIINLDEYDGRQILQSIKSMYTKLTGLFTKRGGVDGIIPDYITRIILIIVLYALWKK